MACLVILPTYNERDNLSAIVESIQQHAPSAHVLVVDDNSPDGTGQIADELVHKDPDRIFVLHRGCKQGLGPAYVAGFQFALDRNYDTIVQMDADFSHDPKYLPLFLDEINRADVVVGSRYVTGISVVNWDLKRLMLSRGANFYVRALTGMPLTDATAGFKCWRRTALTEINFDHIYANGYVFLAEMSYQAFRKNLKITEVPIIFVERRLGRSKFDWKIIAEGFWGVIRMRLRR
jgi:dolichol-phosphate mannosyltransferase